MQLQYHILPFPLRSKDGRICATKLQQTNSFLVLQFCCGACITPATEYNFSESLQCHLLHCSDEQRTQSSATRQDTSLVLTARELRIRLVIKTGIGMISVFGFGGPSML